MSNLKKVQDLIERAENYRAKLLKPENKCKSRLTKKEQEENHQSMQKLIEKICKYNERVGRNGKRIRKNR